MSLPVFCSQKKWIMFFSFHIQRFRLGTFAGYGALYRWDLNILIPNAPKSWKMLPPQGRHGGRKATMHIWIQWSCHILSTETPSSDCFWRQHRCIIHCLWIPLFSAGNSVRVEMKVNGVWKLHIPVRLCINIVFLPFYPPLSQVRN